MRKKKFPVAASLTGMITFRIKNLGEKNIGPSLGAAGVGFLAPMGGLKPRSRQLVAMASWYWLQLQRRYSRLCFLKFL